MITPSWLSGLWRSFLYSSSVYPCHLFLISSASVEYSSLCYIVGPYCLSGEGNGTPLQYSCLENPMDGGAWKAAGHGVAEGQTRLSDFTFTFHFSLSCIGEGNGNPLQCSYLENPRDGEAWWAAVYGVAHSWTQLKWLRSSSIYIYIYILFYIIFLV